LLPVFTLPNASEEAETEIAGAGTTPPVPVTLTVVGLPGASWLMVIVPEYEPAALGMNVTVTV
jgi:hypothetical protein